MVHAHDLIVLRSMHRQRDGRYGSGLCRRAAGSAAAVIEKLECLRNVSFGDQR